MKKRNGFTLVEIISVIGVLLIISAVAIPSIISINKRNKEKNYEKIVENIKTSSENFIEKYRSDIPFDETTGEYYFKINVLGALNLLKLPIKDPRDNSEISNDSCVKVTKQGDGSLNYEFIASECTINASNPELDINTDLAYAKVESTVDLKKYVNDYSSTNTPKRYLKLEIGNLDTSSEGNNKEVIYKVTDLLNGNQTQKTKRFNVLDDQKINVVFLSDSVTKTELDSVDLAAWEGELENKFKTDERFKDTGINFTVESHPLNTTIGSTLQLEYISDLYHSATDLNEVEYYGVFGDLIVAESKYSLNVAGSWDRSYYTALVDINSKKKQRLGGRNCKHLNNTIYCYDYESGSDLLNYRYNITRYYKYVFNDSTKIYEKTKTVEYSADYNPYRKQWTYDYSPSKTDYTTIEQEYSLASSNWNTHINPNGLTYKSSEMIKLLKKYNPSWTTREASRYKNDTYQNVFIHNDKGIGYLLFERGSGTANGFLYASILWEKQKEIFNIDMKNYKDNANKTYLIITANNTNNYAQELTVKNDFEKLDTYLYADSNTLNTFEIDNEKTYSNINSILADLESNIKVEW